MRCNRSVCVIGPWAGGGVGLVVVMVVFDVVAWLCAATCASRLRVYPHMGRPEYAASRTWLIRVFNRTLAHAVSLLQYWCSSAVSVVTHSVTPCVVTGCDDIVYDLSVIEVLVGRSLPQG